METFNYRRYQRNNSLELVSACLHSGMRITEWCRQKGVPPKVYSYHACKLRREGRFPSQKSRTPSLSETASVSFCEVCIPSVGDTALAVEPAGQHSASSEGSAPALTLEYGQFRLSINETAGRELLFNVMEAMAHVQR